MSVPYRYQVWVDGEPEPIYSNVVDFSASGLVRIQLTPNQTLIVPMTKVRIYDTDRGATK
jgi:hypothetical protein